MKVEMYDDRFDCACRRAPTSSGPISFEMKDMASRSLINFDMNDMACGTFISFKRNDMACGSLHTSKNGGIGVRHPSACIIITV